MKFKKIKYNDSENPFYAYCVEWKTRRKTHRIGFITVTTGKNFVFVNSSSGIDIMFLNFGYAFRRR